MKERNQGAGKWLILSIVVLFLIAAMGTVIWYLFTRGDGPAGDRRRSPNRETHAEETEESQDIRLKADYFTFRQTAFRCGEEDVPTLVLAEFYDVEEDLSDLVLCAVCEETGEEILMTDDGEGADTMAGDHVFYGRTAFSSDEEGTLTFKLKSRTPGYKVSAESVGIRFYSEESVELSLELREEIEAQLNELAAGVNTYLADESDVEPYLAAVEEMEAYLQSLADEQVIISYTFSFPYFIIDLPVGGFAYEFGYLEGLESSPTGTASAGSVQEEVLAEEGKKVVLLLPFDGELGSAPFDRAVASILNADLGYTLAARYTGREVSISRLKQLHEYRIIILNGHGGNWGSRGLVVSTGTPGSEVPQEDYESGDVLPSERSSVVTVQFFEHNYEDYSLNNCLIYLGTCHGADDLTLQRVLIRKGARAVFGYRNSVNAGYDSRMVQSVFRNLASPDPTDSSKTMGVFQALTAAKKENGDTDPTNRDWWNLVFLNNYNYSPAELRLLQFLPSYPFRLSEEIGAGTISGRVTAAADGRPIHMARIYVEGESISRSLYSAEDGTFSYSLPEGRCRITVTTEGYYPLVYNCTVYRNHVTYLETMLLIGEGETDTAEVDGFITSALTGQYLPDAALTIRKDWNNPDSGEVVAQLATDEYGGFHISLPTGYYTVLAEKEGYVTASFNIIADSQSSLVQTYSLNRVLEGNQYRIVLTWGEFPEDVDLHLTGPSGRGGTFEVYYADMTYWEGDTDVCMLDVDDTSSYGPETVTLTVLDDERPYYCFLHHYSGSGHLSTSSARLDVYCGSELIGTFRVPDNGQTGVYWNAFAIKNGQIITNNSITDYPEVHYAD